MAKSDNSQIAISNAKPRRIQVSPRTQGTQSVDIGYIDSNPIGNSNAKCSIKIWDQLYKMKVDTLTSTSSDCDYTPTTLNPALFQFQATANNTRKSSTFGKDSKHCLCFVLKPLIIVQQVFGIFPVNREVHKCKLNHYWFSIPAWINYGWIAVSIILSAWVLPITMSIMRRTLSGGTDFYTFLLSSVVSLAASVMIFLMGNCAAVHLSRGWDMLHSTVEQLALPNFKLVKRTVYLIPILLFEGFFMDMCVVLYGYMNDSVIVENVSLLAGGTMFMTNFIPNLVCSSYAVLLWILAINFNAINEQVEKVLKNSAELSFVTVSSVRHEEVLMMPRALSRLRGLHENLCAGARHLEKSFGVQMLVVFCATGIGFVGGIYAVIVATNSLMATNDMSNLTLAFGFSSILSSLRLLMVLVMSQYLMNKSNETGHILNAFDDMGICGEEMQKQVDIFKKKVGEFPLKISCCDIFPISTSIIASATGNTVTYVLVLMQFKLNSKSG